MSGWVESKLPCPVCPSSDAYSINDKGWGKCFVCGVNIKEYGEDEEPEPRKKQMTTKDLSLVPVGEIRYLPARKITEETCKKFGYSVSQKNGKVVQVAPYRKKGTIVAQKLRGKNKKFQTTGDFKDVELFGQHLWPSSGKKLVITEGEIDCMSVSQLQGNKWPVVSLPTGAQSAVSAIKTNLEWVISFEQIILMFDGDDVGKEAAQAVAEMLPTGQAFIAELPLKDANEMLLAGRGQEVIQAIWNAKPYRPDGIISIDEILDDIEKPIEWGLPWWIPELTEYTFGRRWGEIYAFGAGTGIGKTDFLTQQIAYDVTELHEKAGVIYLEAKPTDTGKRIAGKVDGVRYHVPDVEHDKEQLRKTLGNLKGKVFFYDSWGETDWDIVKGKIRYMATGLGVRLFFLDHLTAMADTSNEKESIEQLMKELAGLANELNIIIHFVSHLSTPEGKAHEEGGRVMIKHFKGSRAIGFWSYFMFGLERNQQATDEDDRKVTVFRILKDRYTGQATGKLINLGYTASTGLLYPMKEPDADAYGFTDEGVTANSDY